MVRDLLFSAEGRRAPTTCIALACLQAAEDPSPWRMRSIRENVRETPETPSWNPADRLHVCAILGTIVPLAQRTVVSGPTVAQRWWGGSLHTQTALNFSRCVSRLMPPCAVSEPVAESDWAHVYFLKPASRLPALVPPILLRAPNLDV